MSLACGAEAGTLDEANYLFRESTHSLLARSGNACLSRRPPGGVSGRARGYAHGSAEPLVRPTDQRRRVAAIDTPIPFAPVLEREYLPLEDDIFAAARDLAEY